MLNTARDGGVVTLSLARPERGNALGPELVEALLAAVGAACDDDTAHTLVLRGDGRHLCTGLDLSDLDRCRDGDLMHRLVRIETLLAVLWHAPLRTVALAQGRTWGAGADLFAACEVRLASEGSTFRFPGAQFGIVLGTRRLAERVGADRARTITTEGREWTAAEARSAGLVTAVLGADDDAPLATTWDAPAVAAATARALRAATRTDHRDADLAALVRSASPPGLVARVRAYRDGLRSAGPGRRSNGQSS